MSHRFNRIFLFAVIIFGSFLVFNSAHAQQLVPDQITTMKAVVLEVTSAKRQNVAGTNVNSLDQMLQVKILDGSEQGKIVSVENDYIELKAGDVVYLTHTVDSLGELSICMPFPIRIVCRGSTA